jgi:hypothetical protein
MMKNLLNLSGILFCLLPVLAAFGSASTQSNQSWREMRTVEDVCAAYPDVMRKMLEAYDLDYPGLNDVKSAYQEANLERACHALLDYYRKSDNAPHLRRSLPAEGDKSVASADTILNDVFVIQNVRGKVPYGENGHRDWYYKGPNNDREWAWLSNRHSQIGEVLSVYFETGNPKYAEYIDLFLRDFIIVSMPYPGEKGSESIWRGLEVAARAKVWSRIFYNLLESPYLSPATRLLMLSSFPDHAHYNRNFHGGNNWLTMEISALATVATNFPEYKNSGAWLEYSIQAMTESMKEQVYADGVQTELTSHYHNVTFRNFELFRDICVQANKPLPDYFNNTIEAMYHYIATAMRPDGHRILNNDGDRGSDRELILEGTREFNRPDWEYIATNGKSGIKPSDGPSWFYPWAGQLISRSGFDADAHWSFFDVGPWGSGHQHNDKMHISISAYGRDLLVDAGRFAYTGEVAQKFRPYARGTQGHNSVLIDGKGQMPDVLVTDKPLGQEHFKITPEFDYAWESFDKYINVEGQAVHNRALLYLRGKYWIIVDRIETDKPRKVDVLWHWHPECSVQEEKRGVVATTNQRGNLRVIPVGKNKWDISFIKGQESPEIQGWYSEEYNRFKPNTATIYSTKIPRSSVFVWILLPSEYLGNAIKASILSQTENEISLKIIEKGGKPIDITIPFSNSAEAKVSKN